MLGSSSLTEGNDGEKVAPPLISRSEPQGGNTLTDERCLCNTTLSCIMTDVYFSDKRLTSTSSHPSIAHLIHSHKRIPRTQHTCLASTASCCLNVPPCKSARSPQVPDGIKKAPGSHHFTPPTAHADLQPAAQEVHQHQQYN